MQEVIPSNCSFSNYPCIAQVAFFSQTSCCVLKTQHSLNSAHCAFVLPTQNQIPVAALPLFEMKVRHIYRESWWKHMPLESKFFKIKEQVLISIILHLFLQLFSDFKQKKILNSNIFNSYCWYWSTVSIPNKGVFWKELQSHKKPTEYFLPDS